MLTLEEIVETAITNQPIVLGLELKKGEPLNFLNKQGREVLLYPDGRMEPRLDCGDKSRDQ